MHIHVSIYMSPYTVHIPMIFPENIVIHNYVQYIQELTRNVEAHTLIHHSVKHCRYNICSNITKITYNMQRTGLYMAYVCVCLIYTIQYTYTHVNIPIHTTSHTSSF